MILSAIDTSGWESFLQLISVLFIFIFVMALTYVSTRWIARIQAGMGNSKKNIRVLETFRITNNKYLQIIEVGTVYMVIAVCKDTITYLCEIDKEQLTWISEENMQTPVVNEHFQEILQKLREKLPRK